MNVQLVVIMLVSALVGVGSALLVAGTGWGWVVTAFSFSTTSSLALLISATILQPGATTRARL